MNLVENIVARYLVPRGGTIGKVSAGDFVAVRPQHVMTHDNTSSVMGKFKTLGTKKVANPRQPVFALDHNVQDKTAKNLQKYADIEAFAKFHSVDFYPAGRGIGHQTMVEEGYAFPGTLVVASDSHSNMYGGVGCLGTPVVRTDAAGIWATTQTWWQVPSVINVRLEGELQPGATAKDVIIALCGHFNKDEVLNAALEFTGPGVEKLSVDDRLCIANMTTEWGALCGVFPIDGVTIDWMSGRIDKLGRRGPSGVASDPLSAAGAGYAHPRVNKDRLQRLLADLPQASASASYAKTITLDLSSVTPHVSGPNHVKVMRSVAEMDKQGVRVHKAYIVSCVNSRVSDLAEAARVLRGKKVADGVKLYVAPASSEVKADSEARGDWQALLDAGAIELPAGCGPCIGLGTGLLEDGEVGISATNRNFKGRMGSPNAQTYLASPAVVAASAIAGRITGAGAASGTLKASISIPDSAARAAGSSKAPLVAGFPTKLAGGVVLCHQDNINTDGIYPGKYTYQDGVSQEDMAKVAMENYDSAFGQVAQTGDILVAGYNFGTGSSREQAATCLKYRGIPAVIAGSINTTYTRNAINNGFLVLESPAFVDALRGKLAAHAGAGPTVRFDGQAEVDLVNWEISFQGQRYPIRPVGPAAQEIILAGGLEPWIIAQAKAQQP